MSPFDFFPALSALPGVRHAHTTRLATPAPCRHADDPGAIRGLADIVGGGPWRTCVQVHGAEVRVVGRRGPVVEDGCDAICTRDKGVVLGISVADCCAVYAVDPVAGAIGVAHSGKKGTEQNILGALIAAMCHSCGAAPERMVVQLGPCIRPPCYDVNFAAQILEQARDARVGTVQDCGVCTGCDTGRYYSYRKELGQTGRMLACLSLAP